jgi:flagellar biogenesis protein FliO
MQSPAKRSTGRRIATTVVTWFVIVGSLRAIDATSAHTLLLIALALAIGLIIGVAWLVLRDRPS